MRSEAAARLSAHIGYLFTELPLAERLGAARAAGFDAVEHPQPFAVPAAEMRQRLDDLGLSFSQLCAGTGDATRGEKGIAALPGRDREFLDSLDRSLAYAEAVGCPFVHPMAGVVPAAMDSDQANDTYRRNLDAAVERARGRPVSILIEAIGRTAVPGYHLHRLGQAFALAGEYGAGEVLVLLDTFHAAANGEDAVALIHAHADRLGHIHIADHPGRHEPGTGAISFAPIFVALERVGYAGAIGFEYIPASTTLAGLGWIVPWRERLGHEARAAHPTQLQDY
ncbi:Hydroxypyruvate isomerase [Rubellimicrobium mesophilum DSM 19309]|uniref:Hydroxypyruvate isomerase n=1 Tax=Rubellimicrobium mesophilum DSM 19309 TaxID=442562 RepID=A0A017HS42_9RHOB|nr:TIM barrel protein [Rubellimicrobium mesophilum]EYD76539.1 Hydroxypyruvate isomerase [Rubellimicrobium mesophilum DSM 19309]